MSTILLSIKPKFINRILNGNKKYELRKNKPKDKIEKIIFYASSPVKLVLGEASIDNIIEGTPKEIWEIVNASAGISKESFFSYFENKKRAVAFELKDILKYESPTDLSYFGIKHAPQSYIYLK